MRLESQIVALDQAAIAIRYRVHNPGTEPVMACDALLAIEPSGASRPDPELAYVLPDGEDGASVGKYLAAMPEGVLRESPEPALFREVPPGGTIDGLVRLPLPLRARHPYVHPPGRVESRVRQIRLTIGIIEHRAVPPNRPLMRPYPAAPGLFLPTYGNAIQVQKHLSNTLPLPGSGVPAIW